MGSDGRTNQRTDTHEILEHWYEIQGFESLLNWYEIQIGIDLCLPTGIVLNIGNRYNPLRKIVLRQFETRLPSSLAERFGTTEPMSLCEALKGGDGFKGLFSIFCICYFSTQKSYCFCNPRRVPYCFQRF